MRLKIATGWLLVAVAAISAATPVPDVSAADQAHPSGRARAVSSRAAAQSAAGIDVTRFIPAVERLLGRRYGGVWIEPAGGRDVMHVGVVRPSDVDRARIVSFGGGAPIVVDAVRRSYAQLERAHQRALGRLSHESNGNFVVGVDVPANRIVARVQRGGQDRLRRDLRRAAAPELAAAAAPAPANSRVIGSAQGLDVVVEPNLSVVPLNGSRYRFPPYEGGLNVTVAVGRSLYACTAAFAFRNGFGGYGSTAGHCGPLGAGVVVGPRIVGSVNANAYHGRRLVHADVALYNLSRGRWPLTANIHEMWRSHRVVNGRLEVEQTVRGLPLCFSGRNSGGRCGRVNVANQTVCCDAGRRSFRFSCLARASVAGDSGAPVYYRPAGTRSAAAGILSSSVTIGRQRSTCFTMIEWIEYRTGTRVITRR